MAAQPAHPDVQPSADARQLELSLAATGVHTESLERWRGVLAPDAVAPIEAQALELDAAVRAIADVA